MFGLGGRVWFGGGVCLVWVGGVFGFGGGVFGWRACLVWVGRVCFGGGGGA